MRDEAGLDGLLYSEISEAADPTPAWKANCRLTHGGRDYPLPFGLQGKYIVLMGWVGQDGMVLSILRIVQLHLAKLPLTCL